MTTTYKQPYVILTLGRSGSNNLANSLNQHPEIVNYGEVLGDWTIPYKLYRTTWRLHKNTLGDFLDLILASRQPYYYAMIYSAFSHLRKRKTVNWKSYRQVKAVGFKDFSFNFIKRGLASYLDDNPQIKVINLYRENQLKRLVSLKNMTATKIVRLEPQDRVRTKREKISLDLSTLVEELDLYRRELDDHCEMIDRLAPERLLSTSYEKLFSSPEANTAFQKQAFLFLDVSVSNTPTQLHRKILPHRLSDIVENYAEVESLLGKTRHRSYLEE